MLYRLPTGREGSWCAVGAAFASADGEAIAVALGVGLAGDAVGDPVGGVGAAPVGTRVGVRGVEDLRVEDDHAASRHGKRDLAAGVEYVRWGHVVVGGAGQRGVWPELVVGAFQ
jgi:hypothetical protein